MYAFIHLTFFLPAGIVEDTKINAIVQSHMNQANTLKCKVIYVTSVTLCFP